MEDNTKQLEPYVDLHKVIEHFKVGRPMIEILIREGMPMLRIRKSRRFKLSEVEEWLKNRNKE